MLEYFKLILTKVSFSKELFEKELKKAIAVLVEDEVKELQQWCMDNYGNKYQGVLSRCFELTYIH
jgi:hypothetical protein